MCGIKVRLLESETTVSVGEGEAPMGIAGKGRISPLGMVRGELGRADEGVKI
jgi:hypothetical protein